MSRLQSCQHHELLANCENYMSRLLKKKIDKPQQKTSREKPSSRGAPQMALSRRSPSKTCIAPVIKTEEVPEPSAQQLLHKEVFNNNMATVEVTVRTVSARKRSLSNSMSIDKREPWGKLLQTRKSEDSLSSFNNFDPLRTIHFLSKELQQKLQLTCPGDPSLQQIVTDIQQALYRLPQEVILAAKMSQDNLTYQKDYCGDTDFLNAIKKDVTEKLFLSTHKPVTMSKSAQTIVIGDAEAKKMQKQLEESALKFEATCKQMELSCSKLRAEKDDIDSQLLREKETVKILRRELEERTAEMNNKSHETIKKLQEERNTLEKQLNIMQIELDAQSGPSSEELRTLIQKLREEHTKAASENVNLKNDVTLIKLEKEKLSVLLESRDRQLKELRSELDSIQSMVCSQLLEFKTSSSFSQGSSVSSIVSKNWKGSKRAVKQSEKSVHELYLNNMKPKYPNVPSIESSSSANVNDISKSETRPKLRTKANHSEELPKREKISKANLMKPKPSSNPSNLTITSTMQDFLKDEAEANIKEMFAELKRQAFLKMDLNFPSLPTPFKDTSSLDSRSTHDS